ncbi:hypothetical protein [Niveibacterium microcysteis]|uniref:Transposase n=1 Tax=Niveibacterium microcysteis TaxID=2811415 RepID=A0ABX7M3I6_9RHOO|nr:hypothetical protein [Niveibacterium microcysteis]QSI75274.1 hypothetical protein JY500_12175 [Niveibacterium microcysteis]
MRLALKAMDVVCNGRLELNAGATDLAAAFMAIKKTTTAIGRQVTSEAGGPNRRATRTSRGHA